MKTYTVRRAPADIDVPAAFYAPQWKEAEVARIDEYPWFKDGEKQNTDVRMLYTPDALHVLFDATDAHISADPRELNGSVCADSCVEFFASPWPEHGPDYFNCEINCCGRLHLGFGPHRMERRLVTPALAARIGIRSTFAGPTKAELPADQRWQIYVRIPRDLLNDFCGKPVAFSGSWRANLYRCGGKTNAQYACWNPVGTPRPDFHVPEYFGQLVFA